MSRFNKNNWRHRFGLIKDNQRWLLPVSGKEILDGSSIWNIRLGSNEYIRIMGSFVLEQDGAQISSSEMVDEVEEYFNELIKGEFIQDAEFQKDESLAVSISTKPVTKIIVDMTRQSQWPIEKWEYMTGHGYISGS